MKEGGWERERGGEEGVVGRDRRLGEGTESEGRGRGREGGREKEGEREREGRREKGRGREGRREGEGEKAKEREIGCRLFEQVCGGVGETAEVAV